MRISFEKMHGLGNDFVMIDAVSHPIALSGAQIRHLGDRRRGVGFDQLIQAIPSEASESGIGVRIFNVDGSPAEQCGNGMRCLAEFLLRQGLVGAGAFEIAGPAGRLLLEPLGSGQVRVRMGEPELLPERIPFQADSQAVSYLLDLPSGRQRIGAVNMGNPHAVLRVDKVGSAPVELLGPQVQASSRFPQGVNVGFVEIVSRREIRLRVFERGVGETLACGSGACAAVVALRLGAELDETVSVDLPGGTLVVSWPGEGAPVWMTGPTARVFSGETEL